jgi:hypothetical protein
VVRHKQFNCGPYIQTLCMGMLNYLSLFANVFSDDYKFI